MNRRKWKRDPHQSIPITLILPTSPPVLGFKKWIYIEWAARMRAFYRAWKNGPRADMMLQGFKESWDEYHAVAARHGLHLAPYDADPRVEIGPRVAAPWE